MENKELEKQGEENSIRLPDGKFKKGHNLTKVRGNQHNVWRNQMLALYRKIVTKAEMAKVVRAVLDKAKKGDVHCIKEVLERTLGKEGMNVNIDTDKGNINLQIAIGNTIHPQLPDANTGQSEQLESKIDNAQFPPIDVVSQHHIEGGKQEQE